VLRARLATAAVAIPLLLLVILAPVSWPVGTLVFLAGLVGLSEVALICFAGRRVEQALVLTLGTILLLGGMAGPGPLLAAATSLALCMGLSWILVTRADFEAALRDLGLAFLGAGYVALLLPHFLWLHRVPEHGPFWVIFVLAVGMVGDTAGYFAGRAWGRHQLAPRVSPKKTIEGAAAIFLASVFAGWVCQLLVLRSVPVRDILVLAAAMGVFGQVGDLCESLFKRAFGVKDSGWIFPGHGGVLDRVDSLLFPVVLVYYYVQFFAGR